MSKSKEDTLLPCLERSPRLQRTVSNKKTNLAVFEICAFCVYLRNHLRYKKVIYIYLHAYLKSFQMEKLFFKFGHKIS